MCIPYTDHGPTCNPLGPLYISILTSSPDDCDLYIHGSHDSWIHGLADPAYHHLHEVLYVVMHRANALRGCTSILWCLLCAITLVEDTSCTLDDA